MYSIPYIVFFFLILSFVLCRRIGFVSRNPVLNSYGLLFPLFILVFFSLRAYTYGDVISYYEVFDRISVGWSFQSFKSVFTEYYNDWEYGFLLLMWLCKNIFNNYLFFQFVITTITLYIFALVVRRYSVNVYFPFVCFFVFYGLVICFNTIRNALQIMIFLYSLQALQNKRYIKYLCINILGSLFHGAAFICLLLTPFFLIRLNRRMIFYLFILGNFIFLAQVKWIRPLALSVIELMPSGVWRHRFEFYFVNGFTFAYGISIGYLERVFSFFLIFFFFDKKKYDTILKNRIFINTFYLYILLYLFGSEYVIIFQRICGLLVFSYWFLYPYMYESLKGKRKKYLFLFIFVFYTVLRLISGNNILETRYENILLPHHSFYEYKSLLI